MISKIEKFIRKQKLFTKGHILIAATSGGKDSMALIHILKRLNYTFIVAHCNFKLRGVESDADEQFVQSFCKQNNLTFISIQFNTKKVSTDRKISIQEAARILRYEWFEEIRKKNNANCIVTAHHLNDNIETFIFKTIKGTGIKGMRGMLPKNNVLARPLLETKSSEIENYLTENNIPFREDSSNASTKYARNKIRHEIIPVLKELNSNLEESFENHFKRWREIEIFHKTSIEKWKQRFFTQKKNDFYIATALIKQLNYAETLLFDIFKDYGFNSTDIIDLLNSLDSNEVKYFNSRNYRIIKDKKFLVLSKLNTILESNIFIVHQKNKKINLTEKQFIRVEYKPINKVSKISSKNNYAYLDADKLKFPLIIRRKKDGDYFYPLGLEKKGGQPSKKKVNKFLKDEKISTIDKENVWVLCSKEKIAWILNHRLDERFKITNKTKNVLVLKFQE